MQEEQHMHFTSLFHSDEEAFLYQKYKDELPTLQADEASEELKK